jgi:hypothetical protein
VLQNALDNGSAGGGFRGSHCCSDTVNKTRRMDKEKTRRKTRNSNRKENKLMQPTEKAIPAASLQKNWIFAILSYVGDKDARAGPHRSLF